MYFVDYEKYGLKNPIYINLVRHPISRIQSWYYYVRSTDFIMNYTEHISVWKLKGNFSFSHECSRHDSFNDVLMNCNRQLG